MLFRIFQLRWQIFPVLFIILPWTFFLKHTLNTTEVTWKCIKAFVGFFNILNTNSAYFYASRDENRGLFLLPESYFVKVLSVDSDYCRIEYLYDDTYAKKLTGYAKTNDLTFVDYTPQTPYLYHIFEVRYTIDDDFFENDDFLSQITVTCTYYGDYKIGSKTYCYVLRGDSFGYIPKPETLVYERNLEYEEHLVTEPPAEEFPPNQTDTGMPPAQIALLIAICLLVPTLAALVLKPPKRPPYDTELD